jgi:hypothetical protein
MADDLDQPERRQTTDVLEEPHAGSLHSVAADSDEVEWRARCHQLARNARGVEVSGRLAGNN